MNKLSQFSFILFACFCFALPSLVFAENNIQSFLDQIDKLKSSINLLQQQLDSREIYPVEARNHNDDAIASCTNYAGKRYATTSRTEGLYANWFSWGGCAENKIYDVPAGKKLLLKINTDSCTDCVCDNPNFCIHEYLDGVWKEYGCLAFPEQKGISREFYFVPGSQRIKISTTSCFYLNVYSDN